MPGVGIHRSVLLHEVLDMLALRRGSVFLDATLGAGGHTSAVCEALDGDVTIVGLDADSGALARAREALERAGCGNATLIKRNFRELGAALDELGIAKLDGVLLDLGTSSDQLEAGNRGFSFLRDEPLLMTLDDEPNAEALTAKTIVNEWPEESLAEIIEHYGGERYATRVAQAIVRARAEVPIATSGALAAIIEQALPKGYERGRIHPATRTFQALRIAVNDEWDALRDALASAFERLAPGGRLAVISFHSIEDRAVKRFMQERAKEGAGELLTKKPIVATDSERHDNPRSRSAKLRGIAKK